MYNDYWCIVDAYYIANMSSTTADQQWLNICVRADGRHEWVAEQQWLGKYSRQRFTYLVSQFSFKTTYFTDGVGMQGGGGGHL